MSALFGTPTAPAVPQPPAPPSIDSAAVVRATDSQNQRALQGRASQFMSDPNVQTQATPDRRVRVIGGARGQ